MDSGSRKEDGKVRFSFTHHLRTHLFMMTSTMQQGYHSWGVSIGPSLMTTPAVTRGNTSDVGLENATQARGDICLFVAPRL